MSTDPTSSLARMVELVPPPRSIERYGYAPDWGVLEEQIGLQLPSDYKALASRYGSGEFCDTAYLAAPRSRVEPDPRAPDAIDFFEYCMAMLRDLGDRESLGVWPQPGGVYPAMNLSTGGWMMWIADSSNPDEWEVAQTGVEMVLEPLGCDLTTALVRWFDGEGAGGLLAHPRPGESPYFEADTGRRRLRVELALEGQVRGLDDAQERVAAAFGEDLHWWYLRMVDGRWAGAFDSPRTDLAVRFGGDDSKMSVGAKVIPEERAVFDELIDRLAVAFDVDRTSVVTEPE